MLSLSISFQCLGCINYLVLHFCLRQQLHSVPLTTIANGKNYWIHKAWPLILLLFCAGVWRYSYSLANYSHRFFFFFPFNLNQPALSSIAFCVFNFGFISRKHKPFKKLLTNTCIFLYTHGFFRFQLYLFLPFLSFFLNYLSLIPVCHALNIVDWLNYFFPNAVVQNAKLLLQ